MAVIIFCGDQRPSDIEFGPKTNQRTVTPQNVSVWRITSEGIEHVEASTSFPTPSK